MQVVHSFPDLFVMFQV